MACQSRESHLYASKPLGWSLTLQSSVNYPITDSLAVILQTINQAIKPLCIAGSGPERPGHLHPAGCPICLFIYLYTYLFVWLHFFFLGRVGVGAARSNPRQELHSDSASGTLPWWPTVATHLLICPHLLQFALWNVALEPILGAFCQD